MVLGNRVLRKIFRPKRKEEVAGGWRRLHNEELHNLYTSPDIIRVIKSRRMSGLGWVGSWITHGRGEICINNFCRKT
jgi:hypothetical protein